MSSWVNDFNLSSKQAKSIDGKDLGGAREVDSNYILTELYINRE